MEYRSAKRSATSDRATKAAGIRPFRTLRGHGKRQYADRLVHERLVTAQGVQGDEERSGVANAPPAQQHAVLFSVREPEPIPTCKMTPPHRGSTRLPVVHHLPATPTDALRKEPT